MIAITFTLFLGAVAIKILSDILESLDEGD